MKGIQFKSELNYVVAKSFIIWDEIVGVQWQAYSIVWRQLIQHSETKLFDVLQQDLSSFNDKHRNQWRL